MGITDKEDFRRRCKKLISCTMEGEASAPSLDASDKKKTERNPIKRPNNPKSSPKKVSIFVPKANVQTTTSEIATPSAMEIESSNAPTETPPSLKVISLYTISHRLDKTNSSLATKQST